MVDVVVDQFAFGGRQSLPACNRRARSRQGPPSSGWLVCSIHRSYPRG
jgi:hypothetical protein